MLKVILLKKELKF